MDYSVEFIRELFYRDLERARRMTPAARFLAGPELWDMACSISKSGIRHQNPQASEEEIDRLLDERIARGRRIKVPAW